MEKNRISAKRSRDKQKKKLEDLEIITKHLEEENNRLKEDNDNKNNIISKLLSFLKHDKSNKYKNICEKCSDNLPEDILNLLINTDNSIINNTNKISSSNCKNSTDLHSLNKKNEYAYVSHYNNNNYLYKNTLFTGIILIVCLIGNIINFNNTNINNNSNSNSKNFYLSSLYNNISFKNTDKQENATNKYDLNKKRCVSNISEYKEHLELNKYEDSINKIRKEILLEQEISIAKKPLFRTYIDLSVTKSLNCKNKDNDILQRYYKPNNYVNMKSSKELL